MKWFWSKIGQNGTGVSSASLLNCAETDKIDLVSTHGRQENAIGEVWPAINHLREVQLFHQWKFIRTERFGHQLYDWKWKNQGCRVISLHTLGVDSNDHWTSWLAGKTKEHIGGIGAMYPKVVIVQMPSVTKRHHEPQTFNLQLRVFWSNYTTKLS